MADKIQKQNISIFDLNGKEILKYSASLPCDHQDLMQMAVTHSAENNIPLRNADLRGLKLNNVDLTGIVLDGADLSGAVIRGCCLDRSSFIHSNLNGARIINTGMEKSTLDASTFNHAILYRASIAQSSVIGTSFFGAQIRESNLSKIQSPVGMTSFEGAFIQNTSLKSAVLSNPYLCRSSINKTDFTDVDFNHGQYQSAKFNLVDFTNAKLNFMHGKDVNFLNSNIHHAQLTPANCHLARFTINDKHYGNLAIMPAVITHLEEAGFDFVKVPEQSCVSEMMCAIQLKDQCAIDLLIKNHCDKFGEHNKFGMYAVSFKGKDLSGLKFRGVDFSGSDFSKANMTNTDLSGSCIDGAFIYSQESGKYNGLKLEAGSARNVLFYDLEMHDADLTGADLSYSKFNAVNSVGLVLNAAIMHSVQLEEKTCFREADLDEADLNYVYAHDAIIQGSFAAAEVKNSHFVQCDLSGCVFNSAVLKNTNFKSTDLSNLMLVKTEPSHVHFNNVDLSNAALAGLRASGCDFIKTDLSHADLTDSFFKNSHFEDVDLLKTIAAGALFIDTKIIKCDTEDAINPTPSMQAAAGKAVESKVCVGEEAKAHLERLRGMIKREAPNSKDNNDFDASF